EEASRFIGKIISYEQGPAANAALLVSDADDGFGFEAATGRLRQELPPRVKATEIYRGRMGDAAAKASLIEALNAGQTVVSYFGHGTLSGWRGGVLTASDQPSLNNKRSLSLFLMMTCLNGLFHNPTGDSLAEALIKSNGGAVAVWASSALTGPREQAAMNREAMRQVFGAGATTIGEVTRSAKAVISDRNIRRTWILFGDPATRIR
ncbi:MAG TPA: C25 family cysteine peptidase, partial [Blastocatellia bacterium]|nr:C25 family cysteine peptidase [Blastocatellia bacterium]